MSLDPGLDLTAATYHYLEFDKEVDGLDATVDLFGPGIGAPIASEEFFPCAD